MNQENCYKEMYLSLTNEITDTIERLKAIQQKAEEFYIRAGKPEATALPKSAQILPISDLAIENKI